MLIGDMPIARTDRVMSATFGDEAVLMRVPDGKFFCLDAVSSRIVALLSEPILPERLVALLVDEFAVDTDRCRREVSAFLEQMLDWGLAEQPASPR